MSVTNPHTFILLEDNETDVFLLRRRLSQLLPDLDLQVAGSQAEYERLVRTLSPDVILSDYRLPQYSGIEALMFARKHAPVVPFIFVTGALHNEELAADTILKGASGFVLKNNLDKLDRIIPPLLDGERVAPSPSPVREVAEPKPPAEAPALEEVIDGLSGADAETLAAIRQMLQAKRAKA